MKTPVRRVIGASIALFSLLIIGTTGYILLEGWSLMDSLWMTVITMSTIGFNEVAPLDSPGRIFSIWLIFGTLLIGGYTIGNISAFLIGGEVWDIVKGQKVIREIEKLKDHTVLIAFGRVGKVAAEFFPEEKKRMIIIERDTQKVIEAQNYGYLVIEGDATHDEVLSRAHTERAKSLIIASGSVADNALVALTAREMNPDIFIVARGEDHGSESKLLRAGANRVVVPNLMGGRRLAAFISQPEVVDFLDVAMHGGDISLQLREVKVHQDCPLAGHSLYESNIRHTSKGALVMAIKKPDGARIIAPPSDYVIAVDDILITLGTKEQLKIVNKLAGVK